MLLKLERTTSFKWGRKTNDCKSKTETFVVAVNNHPQAAAVKRDDGLTLSWLYRQTVRCPVHRWSQHAGLTPKDVLTESEKQNRSSKAFILAQKSVHQTRQMLATHCPKDSDVFGEDRRAFSSFKQMEMFLPVRT